MWIPYIVPTRTRRSPHTCWNTSKATDLCSVSSSACQENSVRVSSERNSARARIVAEQGLGEGGGVVLEARGESQLVALRGDLAEDPETDLHPLVGEAGGVAELLEPLVEGTVLAAVERLLPDEALHLLLEHGVGDLVAVGADAADEEVLALGEHRREHGGDVAPQDVVGHEVAGAWRHRRRRCRGGGPRWCAPGRAGGDVNGHRSLPAGVSLPPSRTNREDQGKRHRSHPRAPIACGAHDGTSSPAPCRTSTA